MATLTSPRLPTTSPACIHCHSTYSDGTGTVPEIAAAAQTSRPRLPAADRPRHARGGGQRRGRLVRLHAAAGGRSRSRRDRQNHYLAFGLDEADRPSRPDPGRRSSSASRRAVASAFSPTRSPKGSERFKRGGVGDAVGRPRRARATRASSCGASSPTPPSASTASASCSSFIAAPSRFLDHPPRRNLDEWDRLCARRRCVALGGVDAHQVGIRVRGRVPLRLMAYKRSFRSSAHASAGARAADAATSTPTARPCSARCARATRTSRSTRSRPRAAFGSGRRATACWRWATRRTAGVVDACAVRCPLPARLRLMRDGERGCERRAATRSSTARKARASTASRPTATPTAASARGSSRTRSTCDTACE